MTYEQALDLVKTSLTRIVPDADFTALGPTDKFRDRLELDSLDFLQFVETLAELGGCRLDEDDYPRLVTLDGSARLVAERAV
ncbi:acyl carrier protein [Streptomyces poonensis]|uniref:Acyl carrier protein n=1 Tax=Streptomyces poonensis TaxID=68255 RepID=A0A918PRH2_9ACTN|nr:acyl carrier protein [Streptomyces poonensis]GGZ19920.1 hypothetical protein GCM10010365_45240 [Streptomyces poonensis]